MSKETFEEIIKNLTVKHQNQKRFVENCSKNDVDINFHCMYTGDIYLTAEQFLKIYEILGE